MPDAAGCAVLNCGGAPPAESWIEATGFTAIMALELLRAVKLRVLLYLSTFDDIMDFHSSDHIFHKS
ncbi:hypothetical protein VPNG_09649 [Cytospora leucostoma]|uniref:Uncharacterized protein n=1 Tax=Cytospora leucostoma TaxID=1230097 RepID=A0A423VMJ7_9PEZI|nr:hypothetical protein VPNG_09649 [Cytospora leucostoma]